MKQVTVKIGNIDTVVTVVDSKSKKQILTANDIEMDTRAEKAVQAALQKAKICNKPVDSIRTQAYDSCYCWTKWLWKKYNNSIFRYCRYLYKCG